MRSRCAKVAAATYSVIAAVAWNACNADVNVFTAQVDVRAVAIDSPLKSFTEGGYGLLRYDEDHDGLQLGNVMLDVAGPLTETLRYGATAFATDDGDKNIIDLTEAFVDWRPYPQSALRWRVRTGAFYAPISLENRAVGWESLYSLSPSAINTWVGEEFRTIGTEVTATWMGAPSGRGFDLSFVAAAYGWNDPAGVLIFQRGWAIHDRQTALFGKLPRLRIRDPNNRTIEFFDEIDDRIGYYAGAELKWGDDNALRVLHYDNLGDPADRTVKEPDWDTAFDAAGVRWQLPQAVTFIGQWMKGDTEAVPTPSGRGMFVVDYWSWFGLLSRAMGPHRVTVRYDRMVTATTRGRQFFNSEQNAKAWTLAYLFNLNDHWQFAAEALRNEGSLQQRAVAGLPVDVTEDQLQLAVRYTF